MGSNKKSNFQQSYLLQLPSAKGTVPIRPMIKEENQIEKIAGL